jgi:hypothetical protein
LIINKVHAPPCFAEIEALVLMLTMSAACAGLMQLGLAFFTTDLGVAARHWAR